MVDQKICIFSKFQFLNNYNMSKTPISEMSLSKLRPDSCFSAKITPIYGALIKKPERARLCEFETHVPPPTSSFCRKFLSDHVVFRGQYPSPCTAMRDGVPCNLVVLRGFYCCILNRFT